MTATGTTQTGFRDYHLSAAIKAARSETKTHERQQLLMSKFATARTAGLINDRNSHGCTAAHTMAAWAFEKKLFEIALDNDMDFNISDRRVCPPLFYLLVTEQDVETSLISWLVKTAKAELGIVDDKGWTALHYATASKDPIRVKTILELCFTQRISLINAVSHAGVSALHLAVVGGAPNKSGQIVEQLLANGADPSLPTSQGKTAFDFYQDSEQIPALSDQFLTCLMNGGRHRAF